jgi:hypothetical protein
MCLSINEMDGVVRGMLSESRESRDLDNQAGWSPRKRAKAAHVRACRA